VLSVLFPNLHVESKAIIFKLPSSYSGSLVLFGISCSELRQTKMFFLMYKVLILYLQLSITSCLPLAHLYHVVMRPSIVIVEQSQAPFLFKSSKTKYHQEVRWGTNMTTCLLIDHTAAGGLLSGLLGGVSQTVLAFVFGICLSNAIETMSYSPHQSCIFSCFDRVGSHFMEIDSYLE
jgi:hypothetical protein